MENAGYLELLSTHIDKSYLPQIGRGLSKDFLYDIYSGLRSCVCTLIRMHCLKFFALVIHVRNTSLKIRKVWQKCLRNKLDETKSIAALIYSPVDQTRTITLRKSSSSEVSTFDRHQRLYSTHLIMLQRPLFKYKDVGHCYVIKV